MSGLEINVSTDGQNGFPRSLSFDTTAGTANIEQLEDCSTYDIKAAFRNKDELGIFSEIFSVSTSLIRKNTCFVRMCIFICVELLKNNAGVVIHYKYLILLIHYSKVFYFLFLLYPLKKSKTFTGLYQYAKSVVFIIVSLCNF